MEKLRELVMLSNKTYDFFCRGSKEKMNNLIEFVTYSREHKDDYLLSNLKYFYISLNIDHILEDKRYFLDKEHYEDFYNHLLFIISICEEMKWNYEDIPNGSPITLLGDTVKLIVFKEFCIKNKLLKEVEEGEGEEGDNYYEIK